MARRWTLIGALALLSCSSSGSDTASTASPTVSLGTLSTVEVAPTLAPASTSSTSTAPPTTIAATTTAPTAPTTAAAADARLRRDGFGTVAFGTEAEASIAALTAELGPPTSDTGWVAPIEIGTCPGTQVRLVSWGVLDLLFGDESVFASGSAHFFGWSYGDVAELGGEPVGLRSPEGIGLGATLPELRAAYAQVVVTPGEEGLVEPTFFVDEALRGTLTSDGDDGTVTVMTGGPYCG